MCWHGSQRQLYAESGSFAWAALYRNRSTMLSNDPLRNREPQACASLGTAAGLVDAVESFENSVLILFRNAHARILHNNDRALRLLLQ